MIRPSSAPAITTKQIEWPTVLLIIIHGLIFIALTLSYSVLSWWLIWPLGGLLIAFHGSLQHEILHGHPTPYQWVNEAMIFPNLALWIPYSLYKSSHLSHHISHQLTDPARDPESYYLPIEEWHRAPNWLKTYYRFYNTFIGRFFWGPIHVMVKFLLSEALMIVKEDWKKIGTWLIHLLACLPVLYWVVVVCEIPFWSYMTLFVYPGLCLTLLRSFIEHQAVENHKERSIIVDTNPLISLIFLNNNLHAVHHNNPHLAWFVLPKVWKSERTAILKENGHYYCAGYLTIICRYWLKPKEQPNYPL